MTRVSSLFKVKRQSKLLNFLGLFGVEGIRFTSTYVYSRKAIGEKFIGECLDMHNLKKTEPVMGVLCCYGNSALHTSHSCTLLASF